MNLKEAARKFHIGVKESEKILNEFLSDGGEVLENKVNKNLSTIIDKISTPEWWESAYPYNGNYITQMGKVNENLKAAEWAIRVNKELGFWVSQATIQHILEKSSFGDRESITLYRLYLKQAEYAYKKAEKAKKQKNQNEAIRYASLCIALVTKAITEVPVHTVSDKMALVSRLMRALMVIEADEQVYQVTELLDTGWKIAAAHARTSLA